MDIFHFGSAKYWELSKRSLDCGSFQPENKVVIRLADWQGSQRSLDEASVAWMKPASVAWMKRSQRSLDGAKLTERNPGCS